MVTCSSFLKSSKCDILVRQAYRFIRKACTARPIICKYIPIKKHFVASLVKVKPSVDQKQLKKYQDFT